MVLLLLIKISAITIPAIINIINFRSSTPIKINRREVTMDNTRILFILRFFLYWISEPSIIGKNRKIPTYSRPELLKKIVSGFTEYRTVETTRAP